MKNPKTLILILSIFFGALAQADVQVTCYINHVVHSKTEAPRGESLSIPIESSSALSGRHDCGAISREEVRALCQEVPNAAYYWRSYGTLSPAWSSGYIKGFCR